MPDDKALAIVVSPDRLSAVAKCDPAAFAPEEFADAVTVAAHDAGISKLVPREELVDSYAQWLNAETKPVELIVAHGEAPTLPTEPVLEWGGDFFSHEFVQNEATGAVDYRQYKSNPSVAAGQRLLTVTPAIPGEDGIDVCGKRLAPPRPRNVRIRTGKNVRFEESTHTYEAERNGRVRFIGGVLSVDEVYTITGDVGLATGNIDHPGALEVQGNIEADTQVRCLGHVKVSGYIESADVEAGGDLEIASGLTGVREGPVKAAGSVRSKFIIDAEVVAGSDVWVDREIVHSIVTAGGRVLASEGRIVGGQVFGQQAIEARDAGSSALVPTVLSVGTTEKEEEERRIQDQRLSKLRAEVDRIHGVVDPLAPQLDQMPPEKLKAVSKLLETEQTMEEEIAELEQKVEERKSGPRPTIIVRGVVYPETTLCIDQVRLHIREPLTGPLRARRVGDQIHLDNI